MFAQVTDKDSTTFNLNGAANVTVKSVIGNAPISGIAFFVSSSVGVHQLPAYRYLTEQV